MKKLENYSRGKVGTAYAYSGQAAGYGDVNIYQRIEEY